MKTWFITGCSEGGFGAYIAQAVLKAGYNAVVTARNVGRLGSVIEEYPDTALAAALDVNDSESIQLAVQAAMEKFGSIDVLVNNAGYCYRSSIEESEEEGVRRMFETNFFGVVRVLKEMLPIMRHNRSGSIVNIASQAAEETSAASGFYAASKAALVLLSEGLRAEVEPLGIRVIAVEPGPFRTHFYDSSLKGAPMKIDDYKETAWKRYVQNYVNQKDQPGDPEKIGAALIAAVEAENPPKRLLLGSVAVDRTKKLLENRTKEIEQWEEISRSADF